MGNKLVDVVIMPGSCLGESGKARQIQNYLHSIQTKCFIIWGSLPDLSNSCFPYSEILQTLALMKSRGTDIIVLSNTEAHHKKNNDEIIRGLVCVSKMIIQLDNISCLVYAPGVVENIFADDNNLQVQNPSGSGLSFFSKLFRNTFFKRSNAHTNENRTDRLTHQSSLAIEHQCKFLISETESSFMRAESKTAKGKVTLILLNSSEPNTFLEFVESKWNFVDLDVVSEDSRIDLVAFA